MATDINILDPKWTLCVSKKHFKPLFVKDECLYSYSCGWLYSSNLDFTNCQKLCSFPAASKMKGLLKSVRLAERILRISPTHAIEVDDGFLIARGSQIWNYNIVTNELILEFILI